MMKATYTKRGCSNHLILRTMLGESTMNVSTSKIHLIVENFSGIVELLSFEKKARNIYGMETRLVDAEEAGGINSEHCVLMVTEGNSAKSFAVCACGLSNLGYRHFFGVLALQGNLPNVSESSSKEVWKNENVQNLMKVLGLGQKKECTRKELRYGYLIIIPDPDMDGIQFKGLLINLFKSLWPSLLKVKGFLHDFMMPIKKAVRVTDGLSRLFYSMPDFESWDRNRKSHATSWKTIHYKRLGSFTKDEAVAYFSQMWLNEFIWEEDQEGKLDGSTLTVAYNKKGVDERKKLIDNVQSNTFRDLANDKRSLKNDFVLFWKANLDRSIAMIFDGLKLSQRKIIFSSFKKNLLEEIELKRFISYVSEHSAYDHGDQNLVLSTILMAQTFVGCRNNINLIEPLGQYGTRNLGGKDHAGARYLSTKLNPLTRLIFPEDDDPFLNYLNDDGRSIQPRWYLPIIPMVLVNGSEGIASGYSSYIPSYNPIDVIDNILRLLDNNQCKPVVPWYKDFKGVIHKSVKGWHKVDGNITRGPPGIFYVYELPLRKTTQAFKKFLQSKTYGSPEAKQPFIESFSQQGDDTVVHFTIKIMADKVKSFSELTGAQQLQKFKLTTRISTNNMHLLDADGQVQHYANIEEIMKVFFEERLRGFRDRGEHTIRNHRLHISILQNKVRYLKPMWDKGIEAAHKYPNDSAPDKMVEELHSKEFTRMKGKSPESDVVDGEVATFDDYEYLLSLPYHTITEKTVEEMETEIVEKQQKLAELHASTPTEKWQQELGRLRTELVKIEAYTVRIEVAEIDNSDDI